MSAFNRFLAFKFKGRAIWPPPSSFRVNLCNIVNFMSGRTISSLFGLGGAVKPGEEEDDSLQWLRFLQSSLWGDLLTSILLLPYKSTYHQGNIFLMKMYSFAIQKVESKIGQAYFKRFSLIFFTPYFHCHTVKRFF